MGERLSWKKIQETYPDQWVGLSEVEWSGRNGGGSVVSAVVSHTGMSEKELLMIQIDTNGSTVAYHTNPLRFIKFSVGVNR